MHAMPIKHFRLSVSTSTILFCFSWWTSDQLIFKLCFFSSFFFEMIVWVGADGRGTWMVLCVRQHMRQRQAYRAYNMTILNIFRCFHFLISYVIILYRAASTECQCTRHTRTRIPFGDQQKWFSRPNFLLLSFSRHLNFVLLRCVDIVFWLCDILEIICGAAFHETESIFVHR